MRSVGTLLRWQSRLIWGAGRDGTHGSEEGRVSSVACRADGTLRSLRSGTNEDLLGFMFTEGQIIAAHFNFDRVAHRREADKFDGRSNQQPHFHQARAAFGWKFYFGDGGSGAQCDRRERLESGGHGWGALKALKKLKR